MKQHLKDHGLNYWQHMGVALSFVWTFTKVVLAALCHAIFPSLFKTYCSDTVKNVYKTLK